VQFHFRGCQVKRAVRREDQKGRGSVDEAPFDRGPESREVVSISLPAGKGQTRRKPGWDRLDVFVLRQRRSEGSVKETALFATQRLVGKSHDNGGENKRSRSARSWRNRSRGGPGKKRPALGGFGCPGLGIALRGGNNITILRKLRGKNRDHIVAVDESKGSVIQKGGRDTQKGGSCDWGEHVR